MKIRPSGRLADYAELRKGGGVLLPPLKKVMLDAADADTHWDAHGIRVIHPSEMAKADWCPRSTATRIISGHRPPDKFSFGRQNIFDEGHAIHAKWQRRMRDTGKLWGDWRCVVCRGEVTRTTPDLGTSACLRGAQGHIWEYREVPLSAESTHLISGRADGAMDDFLVEIKSVGLGTLRVEAPVTLARYQFNDDGRLLTDLDGLWRDLRRPFASHVRQANVYLFMAHEMGLPFTRMVFLYEFKANQQVKEFTIGPSAEVIQPMLDKAAVVKHAVETGVLPECPYGGCAACQGGKDADDSGPRLRRGAASDGARGAGGGQETGGPEHPAVPLGGQARRRATRTPQGHPGTE